LNRIERHSSRTANKGLRHNDFGVLQS